MSERIEIENNLSRDDKYKTLIPVIESVISHETDPIANMANITAILKEHLHFFWVGFYIKNGEELVLGPFQGTLACTRIGYGRGVCGTAWKEQRTILVPDVERFEGHIACSSLSKSEIVVPILVDGSVVAVLDVDSDVVNDFSEVDAHHLEALSEIMSKYIAFK